MRLFDELRARQRAEAAAALEIRLHGGSNVVGRGPWAVPGERNDGDGHGLRHPLQDLDGQLGHGRGRRQGENREGCEYAAELQRRASLGVNTSSTSRSNSAGSGGAGKGEAFLTAVSIDCRTAAPPLQEPNRMPTTSPPGICVT